MEIILNLIWLMVTVAIVWLWRCRWLSSRENPKAWVLSETVAVVCALAILFPVISLTDDLHPEIAIVEAASGKRNACLLVAGITHRGNATAPSGLRSAVAVLLHPRAGLELIAAGMVSFPPILRPIFLSSTGFGRSPPSLH